MESTGNVKLLWLMLNTLADTAASGMRCSVFVSVGSTLRATCMQDPHTKDAHSFSHVTFGDDKTERVEGLKVFANGHIARLHVGFHQSRGTSETGLGIPL